MENGQMTEKGIMMTTWCMRCVLNAYRSEEFMCSKRKKSSQINTRWLMRKRTLCMMLRLWHLTHPSTFL
jgi:hypothetical protein